MHRNRPRYGIGIGLFGVRPGWGLRRLFQRRLFWRFYLTLLMSLLVMVIIGGFIWHLAGERALPPGYDLDARIMEALLPPPNADSAEIDASLNRIANHLKARVSLIAPTGEALGVRGVSDDPHDIGRPANDVRAPLGRSPRAWRIDLPDGRILVARGIHFVPDRPPIGFFYLFLVALVVGAVSFPFVRRITRRLERLRNAVETWGEGHLETRVPERGHDEIATVARTFNIAAARIEELVSAHRTLLAHASHELRSPLARLRMAIEVYESAPSDGLKRAIDAEIGELDQLVDEILLSSRLDHSGQAFEPETVDLLGLAAEEAARSGADLVTSAGSTRFVVMGSSRLLRRLIRNLLENARRHGAPPIEIALVTQGDGITIRVTDHGAGVPEDEWQRVFKPFYRPSGATEAGGSWGLGLALVARIADLHQGAVACGRAPSGGAMFTVVLRATPPA